MDLRRLKIEHSNAITAELDRMAKRDEGMMSAYAVDYMDSGCKDETYKAAYDRSKVKRDTMKQAIEIVQRISREFEFEEESDTSA